MTSSINNNIAAFSAQANITAASNAANASVARLSSGNRIVQASDDVSALAIGTSLGTQVSALKAAQSSASQGTSLLQVADGALAQIQAILQQQQSIANQALAGSLTDTDRGFLNQQFQALTAEIDQIASGTTFNGVQLLNGGLGTTSTLAGTDALAAAITPASATGSAAGTAVAATKAIQAFNITSGAILSGVTAAGDLDVTDSAGTVLANSNYTTVNSALVGQFSSFSLTNVSYGATTGSATVNATINGVTFSGAYAAAASGNQPTSVLLHNGTTYINLGITALTLTDAGTTAVSQAQLGKDFVNTVIQDTSVISGVDFSGTRLAGAVGNTAYGTAAARLNSATANISNFAYSGNTAAADTSRLTVQVNGETFVATGVKDAIATAAGKIVFQSSDGQSLIVDLTGLTNAFTATSNIRLDTNGEREQFINALNEGFSKAGSGLNFTVGSSTADNINVSLTSASSNSLFNGQTLSVGDAASAAAASAAISSASNTVTAIRSNVGALESQFGYASANLTSSVQNQSAAQSSLLDTDIASESTSFATEQVKLQAGISVLAQANQQLQALLKLIG